MQHHECHNDSEMLWGQVWWKGSQALILNKLPRRNSMEFSVTSTEPSEAPKLKNMASAVMKCYVPVWVWEFWSLSWCLMRYSEFTSSNIVFAGGDASCTLLFPWTLHFQMTCFISHSGLKFRNKNILKEINLNLNSFALSFKNVHWSLWVCGYIYVGKYCCSVM